ncbi:MAG: ABC transporter permease [Candidatus ainarchaeum sp.]|nr:ABC transporter permease [Candidatus ainarchaeum sp.]
MVEFDAIYAIWLREAKVYIREKERVIASIVSPLLWLFVFSAGVGGTVTVGETGYQAFVFPGILAMSILFVSFFYGLYIIWDRKLDFLKEVLVAPASRSSIFLGKAFGGMTDAMVQALVLLAVGAVFIMPLGPLQVIYLIPVLLLTSFSTASMGLFMGAKMRSQEGFALVSNLVMWPMFFFSGALFPLENLPGYLKDISLIDPITYAVDAIRVVLLGSGAFPLYYDVGVLCVFAAITGGMGLLAFGDLQQAK